MKGSFAITTIFLNLFLINRLLQSVTFISNFYQIEFKKPGEEEWQEGPKVKTAKFLTGQVNELTTNTKYEFRVRECQVLSNMII
jgi:hypothetical protein